MTGDTARVTIHHSPRKPADETTALYARAVKRAEAGDYAQAIRLLRTVVSEMPMLGDAWRNLGMALLESSRVAEAKETLYNCARLYPYDAWCYLLLGNLYAKQERDRSLAARFYDQALQYSPDDPYTLTSYGGICLQDGQYDKARDLLERAIATGLMYPNAYLGMAMLDVHQSRDADAIALLDRLFSTSPVEDRRNAGVLAEARNIYLNLAREESQRDQAVLMRLVEDARLERVQAVAETTWRRGGDRHVVRYRVSDPLVVPHLVMHELEHIAMESEDRAAGRFRLFTSSAKTREYGIRAIAGDVQRLSRLGFPESQLTSVVLEWVNGLLNQLYSMPLDIVLEQRLWDGFPALRHNQLVSLTVTCQEAAQVVRDPQARRLSPRLIYDASTAINAAFALFCDGLTRGRTAFATAYEGRTLATGRRLLGCGRRRWQAMRRVTSTTSSTASPAR